MTYNKDSCGPENSLGLNNYGGFEGLWICRLQGYGHQDKGNSADEKDQQRRTVFENTEDCLKTILFRKKEVRGILE